MTMNHRPRRDFLRKTAGTLGAASALTMLPPSIQRALAVQADVKKRTIEDVQHIVILMQENRSFDHYFGTHEGCAGLRRPLPDSAGERQVGVFPTQPHRRRGNPALSPRFHRSAGR